MKAIISLAVARKTSTKAVKKAKTAVKMVNKANTTALKATKVEITKHVR